LGQLHGGGNNRSNLRFVPAAETCDQVRNKCFKPSSSLSECTCTRTGNKFIRTNSIAGKTPFDFYALAKYERNDIIATVQFIFIRNDEISFLFHQLLASLCGLNGTPTGKAKETVFDPELVGERLTSVTNGGGRSVNCS